jgi:hypothetical protein
MCIVFISLIDKSKITAARPLSLNSAASSQMIAADSRGISFRFSNPAQSGFRIYAPTGKCVSNFGFLSQSRIDFRSMGISAGMYVVQAFNGNQQSSKVVSVMP